MNLIEIENIDVSYRICPVAAAPDIDVVTKTTIQRVIASEAIKNINTLKTVDYIISVGGQCLQYDALDVSIAPDSAISEPELLDGQSFIQLKLALNGELVRCSPDPDNKVNT